MKLLLVLLLILLVNVCDSYRKRPSKHNKHTKIDLHTGRIISLPGIPAFPSIPKKKGANQKKVTTLLLVDEKLILQNYFDFWN